MDLEKLTRRLFMTILAGVITFNPSLAARVFAGEFSPDRVKTIVLGKTGKAIEISPGAEYEAIRYFKGGLETRTKIVGDKFSSSVISRPRGVRVGYDIHKVGGIKRLHMNIMSPKFKNPQHFLKGKGLKIAGEGMERSRWVPYIPESLKGSKHVLEIKILRGGVVKYSEPGKVTRIYTPKTKPLRVPIDPTKRSPNTIYIMPKGTKVQVSRKLAGTSASYSDDVARAASKTAVNYSDDVARSLGKVSINYGDDVARVVIRGGTSYSDDVARALGRGAISYSDDVARTAAGGKVGGLVAASMADGPQIGPIDVILLLWGLYEFKVIAEEFLVKEYEFDCRAYNRWLKLNHPELYEDSPIDIDEKTGQTIIKNPRDYYSDFPEPYRSYMLDQIKRDPLKWQGSQPNFEMSDEERRRIQSVSRSGQGYMDGSKSLRMPVISDEEYRKTGGQEITHYLDGTPRHPYDNMSPEYDLPKKKI